VRCNTNKSHDYSESNVRVTPTKRMLKSKTYLREFTLVNIEV
jgi:hypothetical protein